jgi:hypothetical protein
LHLVRQPLPVQRFRTLLQQPALVQLPLSLYTLFLMVRFEWDERKAKSNARKHGRGLKMSGRKGPDRPHCKNERQDRIDRASEIL